MTDIRETLAIIDFCKNGTISSFLPKEIICLYEKTLKEANSIKTLEEHNAEKTITFATYMSGEPCLNGIKCPECSNELFDNGINVTTTQKRPSLR